MRVLMLSWEYPPHFVGGLGRHVSELAPALASERVQVHVVTPLLMGGEQEERPEANLLLSRLPPTSTERSSFITFVEQTNEVLAAHARTLAEQHGPFDLIHAHDWLVTHAGVALKYAWQRPLVGTIHSTEWGRSRGLIRSENQQAIDSTERRLASESWRTITVSNFMSTQLCEIFAIAEDKIDVVYNAVRPLQEPVPAWERQSVRRRYAADHECIVFSVGRMVHEKGFHTLIEAAPAILAAEPNTRFVIAGTGDLRGFLQQRAHELGVAEQFHFTGFIPDTERDRLYQVADVAVFPSLYEPFGIVALEAMAARCPVVVTETGGLQEVVRPHETGISVSPDNADSLAWGVLHTLQHPDWAQLRVESAFRSIQDQFTWQRVARQTIEVYSRVSEEWRHSEWGSAAAHDVRGAA